MTITVKSTRIDFTGGSFPAFPRIIPDPAGNAPLYAVRAYAVFDSSTTANGSAATLLRANNISSVVRNASGNYTVNMTTAMPDANYCVLGHGGNAAGNGRIFGANGYSAPTSSQFTFRIQDSGGTAQNPVWGYITVIR